MLCGGDAEKGVGGKRGGAGSVERDRVIVAILFGVLKHG
jgi:hypothetical protein